jgi:hypothetical protein
MFIKWFKLRITSICDIINKLKIIRIRVLNITVTECNNAKKLIIKWAVYEVVT